MSNDSDVQKLETAIQLWCPGMLQSYEKCCDTLMVIIDWFSLFIAMSYILKLPYSSMESRYANTVSKQNVYCSCEEKKQTNKQTNITTISIYTHHIKDLRGNWKIRVSPDRTGPDQNQSGIGTQFWEYFQAGDKHFGWFRVGVFLQEYHIFFWEFRK